MYLRTVKVRSSSGTVNEYVRVVEAYRDKGKVKQRTVADLGRMDLLAEIFPKLQRLLGRDGSGEDAGKTKIPTSSMLLPGGRSWSFGLCSSNWDCGRSSTRTSGKSKGVPFADRALVLIANRLTHPASEHGLAGWLETDFVCDRQGRRFIPRWHQHNRVRV